MCLGASYLVPVANCNAATVHNNYEMAKHDKKRPKIRRRGKKKKASANDDPTNAENHAEEEFSETDDQIANDQMEDDAGQSSSWQPSPATTQVSYGVVASDIRQYLTNVDKMLDEQVFEDAEGSPRIL